MRILSKRIVNRRDTFWRKDVRHIGAEIEEIVCSISWVPIEFLPGVGWVEEWASDLNLLESGWQAMGSRYGLGKAIVAAKSLISDRASSPKIALNSWIAFLFWLATSESNLSTIALILAMQSDGPNF